MPKTARILPEEQFIDLSLYYYGYEECVPGLETGPCRRDHFTFHYIYSGKGRYVFTDDKGNDNEVKLEKDQGFLVWPGQDHLYTADKKDPWTRGWLGFNGMKAREYMIQAGLSFNYPIYIGKNNDDQKKMKSEILGIIQDADALPMIHIGRLYLCIGSLINSSSASRNVKEDRMRNFYINESVRFIEQHYHEDINAGVIAAACGIDRSYLGKIFRRHMHSSPHKFLLQYRINKACELLKTTDYSIGEIGAMSGYSNQFSFSRIFKNALGLSPSEWKNQHNIAL